MTYFDVRIGLPLTENATSPERGCRRIETGVIGLTLGMIDSTRSALAALWWVGFCAGVRYFERDAWDEGIGVFCFIWFIIDRGPGVEIGTLLADWLRRRDLIVLKGATTETFPLFWEDDLLHSDSEVLYPTSAVRYPY